MRSLFLKVFSIFWIAESLIFVISTAVILNRRFPRPGILLGPMFEELKRESAVTIDDYRIRGCAAITGSERRRWSGIVLQDGDGRDLCPSGATPFHSPMRTYGSEVSGQEIGSTFWWTVPSDTPSGQRYILLFGTSIVPGPHSWYEGLLHFAFPQVPVAIAVGGATTFLLVLIFTRPIVRLRKAARQLAEGSLEARVIEHGARVRFFSGDELDGLVHDFNHMAERLQSLVEAQELLLRDVSHELRSPLARLSVALELSRDDANPTMRTHLDRMERETGRLNQLIGQLLGLSSISAVERVERVETISLREMLEEMIPDADYEASRRSSAVVLRQGCECFIEGSRELIYRAIENVVRNAIRYTAEGSEVEVRIYPAKDEDKRLAVVEVSDRGPGIPESELQSVFRPFYRVDRSRNALTGGFGVGLAITERAVLLHQGSVKALNRFGGGATIRMCFPLAELHTE